MERIDDAAFATSPACMEPHRAGAHLRHVVEFYQAFLEGARCCYIDYDARRRNVEIERSRAADIDRHNGRVSHPCDARHRWPPLRVGERAVPPTPMRDFSRREDHQHATGTKMPQRTPKSTTAPLRGRSSGHRVHRDHEIAQFGNSREDSVRQESDIRPHSPQHRREDRAFKNPERVICSDDRRAAARDARRFG